MNCELEQWSGRFNQTTVHAIKSVFLGVRIHDAAVLCDLSDRLMREQFLQFCKHKNNKSYEQIAIESSNAGYTTPPVKYFRCRAMDYFTIEELTTDYLNGLIDEVEDVLSYYERCISNAAAKLSICRARHQSFKAALELLDSQG